jgi:hypothetical protein
MSDVFDTAESPYGIPFICFPSYEGDAMTFMTPGHLPMSHRLAATFSYILRRYEIVLVVPRKEFAEWGYATYTQRTDDANIWDIEVAVGGSVSGVPVTFCEL